MGKKTNFFHGRFLAVLLVFKSALVTRIAAAAFLLLVPAETGFPQETLNTYYAYPVSIGAAYLPFSPVGSIERQAEVNELPARVRVPLPFSPVLQPFFVAGLAAVDADGSDQPTVLGRIVDEGTNLPNYDPRDTWNHQEWYGGLGIGVAHRISKEFETGLDLYGAVAQTYFPQRVVTADGQWYPVGEPGFILNLPGKISLNPSYNTSIDVLPAFRYRRTVGNLPDFDGLYFGFGVALNYRFGQDPDAPQAEVRALRFTVDELPPVFAAMQKVYVRRPISHFTITNTEENEVRDTLRRGTGDCDDLTVLCNTMLESVGVPSGFITVPGHIYSAVDTGVSPRDFRRVHPDREMTLAVGDSLWVLVEITLIGRFDFHTAWEAGMAQWYTHRENETARAFYTTRESQLEYEPVGLQETDIGLQYGDPELFLAPFRRDRDRLADLIPAPLREQTEGRDSPVSWNRLGVVAARLKRYQTAEAAFSRAAQLDAGYLAARANLGSLRYLREDYQGALAAFEAAEAALARAAQPPPELTLSIYVNLAQTLHALERQEEAGRYVAAAADIDPEAGARYRYIAAADSDITGRASAGELPSIRFIDEEAE